MIRKPVKPDENKEALNLFLNTFELKQLSRNEVFYLQFPVSPGIAVQRLVRLR